MKLADYAASYVPNKYVILGVELKPLCLGHYLLMHHFDCGFASDTSREVGYDDLILGIVICSMKYQDFLDFINNKVNGKPAKLWYAPWKEDTQYFNRILRSQGKLLKKYITKHKIGITEIQQACTVFTQYIKEHTSSPKYWESEQSTGESGAHWSQTVFTTAISNLGYTREQALNTSLRQLFNDFYKYAESQGGLTLMSEEEETQVEQMEEKT